MKFIFKKSLIISLKKWRTYYYIIFLQIFLPFSTIPAILSSSPPQITPQINPAPNPKKPKKSNNNNNNKNNNNNNNNNNNDDF